MPTNESRVFFGDTPKQVTLPIAEWQRIIYYLGAADANLRSKHIKRTAENLIRQIFNDPSLTIPALQEGSANA